jgi:transcriptional regulator with XRE-family HTH domain
VTGRRRATGLEKENSQPSRQKISSGGFLFFLLARSLERSEVKMSAFENGSLASNLKSEIRNGIDSSNPGVLSTVAAREVLRCNECHLVQYRTLSDLCRRCGYALPRPQADLEAVAEQAHASLCGDSAGTDIDLAVPGKAMQELSLGASLRAIRESRNLTQAQLAKKAHVPRTYVSRIEHAHLLPGLGVAQRLADALGVGLLDLVPSHSGGGGSRPAHDGYWNSLVRFYRGLGEEQRYAVLSKVRAMLGQRRISHAA